MALINWDIVLKIILEDMDVEHLIAYSAIMSAGAFLFFFFDVRNAVRRDDATSKKFSWRFMMRDNVFRGGAVLLAIVVIVIFYDDFFGVDINPKLALMQGLSIDAVIGTVLKQGKRSGVLKKSRQKRISRMTGT